MGTCREKSLHIGLVLLAGLVVYANTLANGFLYDDLAQILSNHWLKDPASIVDIFTTHVWGFSAEHPITNYYRPLMHSANLLVYSLFGPKAIWFHMVSLLLHLACCGLLYLVVAELCRKFYPGDEVLERFLPLLGGLFFAVYPANSEAVAWLGSSADLMCACFLLVMLYCHLLLDKTERKLFLVISVLAFSCALLSKETALITAPFLLLLVDFSSGHYVSWARRRAVFYRYISYALAGLAYLLVRVSVLGALVPVKKYTLSGALFWLSAMQKFLWYVHTLIWPFDHNFYPELKSPSTYSGAEITLSAFLLCLAITGLLYVAWKNKVLRVMSVFIFVPLFSALQAYALRNPVAERYLYMPAIGFCLILAWLIIVWPGWQRVRIGLVLILVIACGTAAFARNRDFIDSVTIWGDAAQKSPRSVDVRSWYAKSLFENGQTEEGVDQAKIILELGSDDPANLYKLAEGLQTLERYREAQFYYEKLLALSPGDAWGHAQLGRVFLSTGDSGRAIAALEQAARLNPEQGAIRYWLGTAYEKADLLEAALSAYAEAERLLPADSPERIALREKAESGDRPHE